MIRMRSMTSAATALLLAAVLPACDASEPGAAPPDAAEAVSETGIETLIASAAEGAHRSEAHIARNEARNPVETLTFFGLTPGMTVIEIWPGAGWYSEVLAPVLREEGRLIVANFPEDAEGFAGRAARSYREKLEAEPEIYDAVDVIAFAPPEHGSLGEAGQADMVLLSRHFHNLIAFGIEDAVLEAAYEALRAGGVLGVIQHRAHPDAVPEAQERTGYVRESFVIERAEAAGFEHDASSEVNANPDDPRDHPEGVWTLPPTLRLCAEIEDTAGRAECEERYRAIGESDRMTLRFVKPQ